MTGKIRSKIKGMTLIEVIIVIVIILALLLLLLWFFRKQIFRGNDGRRKGDLHNLQVAVEEYEKDFDCYPLPSTVVCEPGTGLKPYVSKIPCDPVTKASYYYEHEDSACPNWYKFYATLETESFGSFGPGGAFNYYVGSPNAPKSLSEGGEEGGEESGGGQSGFYGCIDGVCVPLQWDPDRPGPECDPNYQNSSCYGQCSSGANECQPWQ